MVDICFWEVTGPFDLPFYPTHCTVQNNFKGGSDFQRSVNVAPYNRKIPLIIPVDIMEVMRITGNIINMKYTTFERVHRKYSGEVVDKRATRLGHHLAPRLAWPPCDFPIRMNAPSYEPLYPPHTLH